MIRPDDQYISVEQNAPNNRCYRNIKDHYMAKDNTSLKNRLITLSVILQRQLNVLITILMFVSNCQTTTLKKTKVKFYIPELSGHRSSRMLTSLEPQRMLVQYCRK